MIFLFDEDAGKETLLVKGENYKYLIKVRRHQVGDVVAFRHPESTQMLHSYSLIDIDGRNARFTLQNSTESIVKAGKKLHIGWCVIDPKSVEKVLPMLNELGVEKITFISCERSQKNFRSDLKRYERMVTASMQQCGRSAMMAFATAGSLSEFIASHPDTAVFDFCENVLQETSDIETVLIGCEGGFSEKERELLSKQRRFRLDTPLVLRSESAAVAVSSKILL